MKADRRCEGVQGVRKPRVKLVWGGGERGRWDVEGFDWFLQAFPVSFVRHGSGGGAFVGRRGEVDDDRDVVCPGRG